jgi:dihydroorotase
MKTRIRGATVVFPDELLRTDLIIDGEQIGDVDAARQIVVDEEVDASGLYLIPGVIDDQVHFREPGLSEKEDLATGSRACAKGGVTTFLEMPNTRPATTSCELLLDKLRLASRKSIVNYGFYIGATPDNLGQLQQAHRTPGIKIFIGSSTGDLLVDDQEALERIFAETELPIAAHCEDETIIRRNAHRLGPTASVADHSRIRDRQAAVAATRRALDLAARHRHRFHLLHVSTADEIELLARHRGLVTAEVCPHHLFFCTEDYAALGSRIQTNPSVKSRSDNEALWHALVAGHIQLVATDHAPHTREEKQRPYPDSPSGVPAVENSLALLLDQVNRGRCELQEVVQWMCAAPARAWDIVNKGYIQTGYDADLVLVDLNATLTIRDENQLTKCGWSPWHGTMLQGWPVSTWVMGKLVYNRGTVEGQPSGREVTFDHARGGYWQSTP